MSTSNSWKAALVSNLPYILAIVFSGGVIITQLGLKPGHSEVRTLAEQEVKDHAFDKEKGIRLEENVEKIKYDVEHLKRGQQMILDKLDGMK